ncbi:uncharacterized protein LOC144602684 [Rhinoraja longicauda]
MNDTGRYHCQVTFMKGGIFHGSGTAVRVTCISTAVTVTRSGQGGQELSSNLKNILLSVFGSLALALLAMALILTIYLRRRCRSPDKGNRTEECDQGNDTSKNIIYADLNIQRSNRNHHSGHGAGESGAAAGGNEESVVYSALRHPAPADNPASSKAEKNPRRKAQQIVYATVNVQRPPRH